jgi:hypothetical protein
MSRYAWLIPLAVIVACIVGIAIEGWFNERKHDNRMRRRRTDWPQPSKDCQRFGEDWKVHKPDTRR